jgi:copper chaperone CopZ
MNDPTMTITVEGMSCDGCARSVRAALLTIDGVTEAQADPQTGTTHVRATREIDRAQLAAALEEAGFSLR